MYNESTTIVDVITLGEDSYELSMKAEDLWVAFEVVRRHIDANGVRHYSQMVEAKITSDGYSFKFDTGDVYTCASHEEHPASETMSDESGGGSGGGVLVVTDTDGTLDKTWQEIVDADLAVVRQEINSEDDPPPRGFICPVIYHEIDAKSGVYVISVLVEDEGAVSVQVYAASSADDYPEISS